MVTIPKCSPETLVFLASENNRRGFVAMETETLESIFYECCCIFNEDPFLVRQKIRKPIYLAIREIYCFVSRTITRYTWNDISLVMGGKEHSKALNAYKKVAGYIKVQDPSFIYNWDKYIASSKIWKRHCEKNKLSILKQH